jgi:hypothetical protein
MTTLAGRRHVGGRNASADRRADQQVTLDLETHPVQDFPLGVVDVESRERRVGRAQLFNQPVQAPWLPPGLIAQ